MNGDKDCNAMDLTVRYPQIDFEDCFPVWAPHLEFAMKLNVFSLTPVHLEPYIIRVFTEARKRLDPVKDAALIKEVDWFIAQEAQHYRQHQKFNRVFQTPRYPKVETLSNRFRDDLERFRTTKSLIFNLAYAEGFESGGGVFYRIWFEKLGKFRFGAKEEALLLYDWHFAEEFEHREVAFKLYMAIAARGSVWRRIWYGWFYRVYAMVYFLIHSTTIQAPLTAHLLEVERSEMTAEAVKASKRRARKMDGFMFWSTIRGLLAVLSPFYDPGKKAPPMGLAEVLREFEPGGRYARKMKDAAPA